MVEPVEMLIEKKRSLNVFDYRDPLIFIKHSNTICISSEKPDIVNDVAYKYENSHY
jgi:hypothetical protein